MMPPEIPQAEAPRFKDRRDAGRQLADKLLEWEGRADVVVLGLPRGGVPVAFEVAARLGAQLDLWIGRKLGVPGREEVAMGAIATGGITVLNDYVLRLLPNSGRALEEAIERESTELQRRESVYRGGREAPDLREKVV